MTLASASSGHRAALWAYRAPARVIRWAAPTGRGLERRPALPTLSEGSHFLRGVSRIPGIFQSPSPVTCTAAAPRMPPQIGFGVRGSAMTSDRPGDNAHDATGDGTRWLSYADLGKALSIKTASAKRLALRRGWPRREGNAGHALVAVPVTALVAPDITEDATPDISGDVTSAEVAALREAVARREGELAGLREAMALAKAAVKDAGDAATAAAHHAQEVTVRAVQAEQRALVAEREAAEAHATLARLRGRSWLARLLGVE